MTVKNEIKRLIKIYGIDYEKMEAVYKPIKR